MKDFDFYVKEEAVKKVSPDYELAKSLIDDSHERFKTAEKLDAKDFSKLVFENVYDSLRDILDAILAVRGFKSYSHEASIAFLKRGGIEESTILELDNFRHLRNSSKYYGKKISADSAAEILRFYKKHANKFEALFKKMNSRAKK